MKKIFITAFIFLILGKQAMALNTVAQQAIVLDYNTGEVLFRKSADQITTPSSMTKIMTAYVILDMLENGDFSLSDRFKVSVRAWRQEGSRMFLEPEWRISVDELLLGLIVQSGNDAAIALAEGSSGSIEAFVEKMNETAKKMGLRETHFVNPTGLHDRNHYMSVRDVAILSRNLIAKHPKYYRKYFKVNEYKFNNINQRNRNWLLQEYEGADGIKTGHTSQGGYSIAASAIKHNQRFIVVINGLESERSRINESKKLLDYAFNQYAYVNIFKKGEIVGAINVLFGKEKKVQAYVKEAIDYPTTKANIKNLKIQVLHSEYVSAPIAKDDVIGKVVVLDGTRESSYNIYALQKVDTLSNFSKFIALFKYNCYRLADFIAFWN